MTSVRLHRAEGDRLDSLDSYGVLDTGRDPAFDALTALAARICSAPVALVSLVDADRQWFKSSHGTALTQTPRQVSFCSDAVAAEAALVVPDAEADPRYRDNPLVTGEVGVRAYAGVPLVGRDGLPLGTLCVLDRRPRPFAAEQLAALRELATQVVALLEQTRQDRSAGLLADCVLDQARDPVRLRRALDDGELVPHYQPIVDLASGRVCGLEALLRWEHPEIGLVGPSAFLPAVEAGALVVPVGRAALNAALAQLAELRRHGIGLVSGVAVNVASGQLARPGLAWDVLRALERHGVAGHELALEITEATALPDPQLASAELGELVQAGVRVVVDDFGVGWSNLSRVLELPVSAVKLDRTLVGAVVRDRRAAAMVTSTVRLAADLDLHVIAEGVETDDVRRYLLDAGCGSAQGWLFSPAVPGSTLPSLIERLEPLPVPAGRGAAAPW